MDSTKVGKISQTAVSATTARSRRTTAGSRVDPERLRHSIQALPHLAALATPDLYHPAQPPTFALHSALLHLILQILDVGLLVPR